MGLADAVDGLGVGNSGGIGDGFFTAFSMVEVSIVLVPDEISGSFGAFPAEIIRRIAGTMIAPKPIIERIDFVRLSIQNYGSQVYLTFNFSF